MKRITKIIGAVLLLLFVHSSMVSIAVAKENNTGQSQKEFSDEEFDWNYQWETALRNEQAVADLKLATILMLKCDAGKKLPENYIDVQKDCEDANDKLSKAENAAMLSTYASMELIVIMEGKDDKLSVVLAKTLKKQVADLRVASFLKHIDPDQYQSRWKKLVKSIQSGEFSKIKTP